VTEKALWRKLVPRLRGRWWRLEAVYPAGMPDVFGFHDGRVHFVELKIGVPAIGKLRPHQLDFLYDCARHDIPYWTCFGHRGNICWRRGSDFALEAFPDFFRAH